MPAGPAVLPWSLSRRKMGLNSSPAFPNHSLSHPRALGGVPAVPRGDQQQQLPVPSVKHGAADAKTMSECEMHVWMVVLLQPLAESLLECRGRSAVCLLPSALWLCRGVLCAPSSAHFQRAGGRRLCRLVGPQPWRRGVGWKWPPPSGIRGGAKGPWQGATTKATPPRAGVKPPWKKQGKEA